MSTVDIQLQTVEPQQKQVLQNLLEFYVYEFSAYISDIELQETGLYGFEEIDTFFHREDVDPYFIRANGHLVGFVIVKTITLDEQLYTIDQFFVVKKYQGRGVGKQAAEQIFARFPGRWRVTQIEKNYPAQAFWRRVIHEYTGGKVTESYDERRRSVQEFDNRRRR